MAITVSGLYGLTLEKFFLETVGASLESTAIAVQMVTDGYTPAYDTHDFEDDVTNEVTGTGYTAGGKALDATPTLTVGSPAAGQLKYDAADVSWTGSTISSAMAAVGYVSTGVPTTAELVWLSDFVTAASTSSGTFTIQWHATDGIFYIDYTP